MHAHGKWRWVYSQGGVEVQLKASIEKIEPEEEEGSCIEDSDAWSLGEWGRGCGEWWVWEGRREFIFGR